MSTRAWLAFVAMIIIWGIPYLFIKIAIDDGIPPLSVAFGRSAIGAAVLLPLALRAGVLSSLKGCWRWVIAYALAEITLPFALIPTGERHVASSFAAILIATTPLITGFIALSFNSSERPTITRLIGLLVGFAGVVVFLGIDVGGHRDELLGALAMLGAAAGYATGATILKARLPQTDPRAVNTIALAFATLALAPLAVIEPPSKVPSLGAIGAITILGLICSAAGFVIFGVLVGEAGPSRSVVVTYLNPVVAVGLGVAVLNERPGNGALGGLALILAGSWLATHGRMPGRLGRLTTWATRSITNSAHRPGPREHRLADSTEEEQLGGDRR